MPSYKAPTVDYQFLMHHVFDLESYNNLSPFKEASSDLIDEILEEAAKLTENVFQPLNQSGDEEGCKLENGTVLTPKGFKKAYDE